MAVAYQTIKGLHDMEESRIIRISSKNQVTIPQKYVEALGLSGDVECILKGNEIIIRRLVKATEKFDDFSDLILKDLVDQGFSGEELINAFVEAKNKIKDAGQKLREEVIREIAKDTRDPEQVHNEIFGHLED